MKASRKNVQRLSYLQADPSLCSLGFVDVKTKVAFQHMLFMQLLFCCQQRLGHNVMGQPVQCDMINVTPTLEYDVTITEPACIFPVVGLL